MSNYMYNYMSNYMYICVCVWMYMSIDFRKQVIAHISKRIEGRKRVSPTLTLTPPNTHTPQAIPAPPSTYNHVRHDSNVSSASDGYLTSASDSRYNSELSLLSDVRRGSNASMLSDWRYGSDVSTQSDFRASGLRSDMKSCMSLESSVYEDE